MAQEWKTEPESGRGPQVRFSGGRSEAPRYLTGTKGLSVWARLAASGQKTPPSLCEVSWEEGSVYELHSVLLTWLGLARAEPELPPRQPQAGPRGILLAARPDQGGHGAHHWDALLAEGEFLGSLLPTEFRALIVWVLCSGYLGDDIGVHEWLFWDIAQGI